MSRPRRTSRGQAPLALVEDAIQLLRIAPPWLHMIHLAGSGMFVLALIGFWSDMTRGVFADRRLASGAAGVALLYLLMKTAHAVHAAELRALCAQVATGPWTAGRLARVFVTQAVLQPLVFLLLPITVFPLLLVPFPWVLAWFQSVSICGDESHGSVTACARHAWHQALAWPGQNHGIVGILLLVATAVLIDVAVAVATAPYLAHLLLGIETNFNLGVSAYFNSTFLLSLPLLAYLVLDPFVKAIYVLRGFQSDSIRTGADLLARFRWLVKSRPGGRGPACIVALAIAAGSWVGQPAPLRAEPPRPTAVPMARPPSVDPVRLSRDLGVVLDQAEYQWRAPRELGLEEPGESGGQGPIQRWLRGLLKDFGGFSGRNLDALFSAIERFLRFLMGGFQSPTMPSGDTQVDWLSGLKALAWILLAAALVGLAWILLRLRKARPVGEAAPAASALPSAIPDLEAETVSAELLPEDGWLALSSEKAALGEWRLALRAVYLGSLAHLARREFLRLAPAKSNHEYLAELRRRARGFPAIPDGFQSCARRFERVWYGSHEATPQLLDEARADLEGMRGSARP